jgi:hypothetical protein
MRDPGAHLTRANDADRPDINHSVLASVARRVAGANVPSFSTFYRTREKTLLQCSEFRACVARTPQIPL